jgi:carbamoyl-phosphate synthase small subunit
MQSPYTLHFKNHPNCQLQCKNIYGYIPKEDDTPIQTELVFTTAMNGYIETFTDPSYYNQGIVFSYPSIGNYGMTEQKNFYTSEQHKKLVENGKIKCVYLPFLEDNFESSKIQPSFIVVEKWIDLDGKLGEWFKKQHTPVLEVDNVREIVQFIRDNGSQQVALLQNTTLPENFQWTDFSTINYQEQVTTKRNYTYPGFVLEENTFKLNDKSYIDIENDEYLTQPILFIDFGCKNAQLREFISRGINVTQVPWNYLLTCNLTIKEITDLYSGMFLSSGPGDPRAEYIKPVIAKVKELIDYIIEDDEGDDENNYYNRFPIFGICFGHQVIGQALGYEITKLPYGHRGIHHPVRFGNDGSQHLGFITSQNHGYALKDIKVQLQNHYNVEALFTHGFDGTNQGLKITNYNIYSVQFHPEACPGPKDTLWLFDYFNLILNKCARYTPMDFWIKYYNKTVVDFTNIAKLTDDTNDTNQQKTILLIGSGGLQIGQAGEFDYSCSQAIKAYQSLGYRVVLLNPNVATIQTTLADQTYYLPLTLEYLQRVITEQQPFAIAHSFGGQSALNLVIKAYHNGMLSNIEILGTTPEDCEACEDREAFVNRLHSNNLSRYIIPSISLNENIPVLELHTKITQSIQYPLLLRNSMALGGAGSQIIHSQQELTEYFTLHPEMSGVELCQSILGWKEIEMEVMRDQYGNACVMCGMENLDPVGFHTGESVVVAPCQTLNDQILQECRTASIQCATSFNLIGEGNVQFAIHPTTGEIRIIEMNPRLSRSSALASKATAYPIAAIASQIQLGMSLLEIPNTNVSGANISAFYEPVLDYFAIKMPRWDIEKLPHLTSQLGTGMKSVGEVLSISRNYQQAFLNAMSATGNFTTEELEFNIPETEISNYYSTQRDTTHRWIAIMNLLKSNNLDKYLDIEIHPYFLQGFILDSKHSKTDTYTYTNIDSFAGEIPTKSNYRYLTPKYKNYLDNVSTSKSTLQTQLQDNQNEQYKGKVIIIGGGTYRIGSSVEFDWCCVSAARRAKELGYYVVMINDNPETVSTDYQECECLYMENPNITNLKHIYTIETKLCQQQGMEMLGVIVSMGGQTSNNLVIPCMKEGINILGTDPEMIDMAEDRSKFSALLDKLQIDQPKWINAKNLDEVLDFCDNVDYPCIVRPSYVLSGAYMYIVNSREECINKLKETKKYNNTTITVSKFIENAKEIDVDCIADEGNILAISISEHVNHGIHSGDDILISPAQTLNLETLKRVKTIAHTLAIYLQVSGAFNIQMLAIDNTLKLIECNLRSSRTLPFISTLYKYNYVNLATDIILDSYKYNDDNKYDFNKRLELINIPKSLTSLKKNKTQTIGVKMPMFSFHRFPEMNQELSVTMKSTGMTACFSKNLSKAYLRGLLSVNYKLPNSKENGRLLLICGPIAMKRLDKYLLMFKENNWVINKYETKKYKLDEYDLIFYIKDKYLKLKQNDEIEINKLNNVIRTRNNIKLLTPALFGYLDKI